MDKEKLEELKLLADEARLEEDCMKFDGKFWRLIGYIEAL